MKIRLERLTITILFVLLLLTLVYYEKTLNCHYSNECNKSTQKLPSALIIGAAKCGTGTLLEFISVHPNVVGDCYKEVHYFNLDKNFKKGTEWYRRQLPFSNENQITIEKTPYYLTDNNSSRRVYQMNPKMKIIIIVCDPVVRAVSYYLQMKVNGEFGMRGFFSSNDSEFFRKLLYTDSKNNTIISNVQSHKLFKHGFYYTHIVEWLKYFPLEQLFFINGERFKKEPFEEIKKLEKFLELEPFVKREHFVYEKTRIFLSKKIVNVSR